MLLPRVVLSHGFTSLPPMRAADDGTWLETTVPLARARPRHLRVAQRGDRAIVTVLGRRPSRAARAAVRRAVRHILRLDEDLSPFYALSRPDPALAWAARGAGRLARSPTVFEDVVKTICTTNCAWSATERMVRVLVARLGERAAGAPRDSWEGRAFPTPEAMAAAPLHFYRDVVRAGYRGPYLRRLASLVVSGELDLEALEGSELPDEDVARALLSLPGVGPYAAAHVMLLLGRYSLLILDSWTRPTYARLARREASDAAIARRFARYGRYAGLAFWLYLTRDWIA